MLLSGPESDSDSDVGDNIPDVNEDIPETNYIHSPESEFGAVSIFNEFITSQIKSLPRSRSNHSFIFIPIDLGARR